MITNLVNGKRYVGKTQRGYLLRFEEHCNTVKNGSSTYISNAIAKYGRDKFKIELLQRTEQDDWEYWERFYIHKYKTLWTQQGYNITEGGDSNPMNIPSIRHKHRLACNTPEHKEKLAQAIKSRVVKDSTREKIRQNNLNNLERITSGFKAYNESRKTPVAIIDDYKITARFECASEACKFVGRPTTESGNILATCDKYNKNGKRSKIFGYSWTKL